MTGVSPVWLSVARRGEFTHKVSVRVLAGSVVVVAVEQVKPEVDPKGPRVAAGNAYPPTAPKP